MVKYMTHPQHGRMPVYSDTEVEYNTKLGWSLEQEPLIPSEIPGVKQSIQDRYFAKFGKYPHHKMKQESIIAALEE